MKLDWRKLVVIFLVVGLAAGFGGYYSGNWLLAKLKSDALRDNAGQIQLALERYALDHDGSYPQKMQALIDEKYLVQWPKNPYAHSDEPMLPIPAGSPASHGDFVYLGFGPVIFLSPVEDVPPGAQGASAETGTDAEATAESRAGLDTPPTEVDQYFLIFYGPGPGGEITQFAENRQSVFGEIDWDEVALMLTAGAPLTQ